MIAIVFSSIFAGLIAIAAFVIIYYAIETRRQGFKIFRQKLEYFSSIVAINEEEVSFRARGKDMTSGLLDNIGLVGRTASLVLAGPHTTEKGIITRRIISQRGSLEEGAWVRTSLFVHEENPKANLNLDYHDVSFESELGTLTGWHIPEDSNNWIIGIHGHRSYRTETMRFVPTFRKYGLNVLLSDYRNDENAPIDKGGYHMFGLTEWHDLESAVYFCKENGAEKIFLMGHSMGGAILMKYLLESVTAPFITGAILESPALDLNKIIEMKASEIPLLPRGAEYPVKKLVSRMVGLRWEDLNYLKRADELSTQMLLIHSKADETVPVSLSDQLASQRPDIVTYIRLENALHAAAWNTDKEVVESSIGTFITQNINN